MVKHFGQGLHPSYTCEPLGCDHGTNSEGIAKGLFLKSSDTEIWTCYYIHETKMELRYVEVFEGNTLQYEVLSYWNIFALICNDSGVQ